MSPRARVLLLVAVAWGCSSERRSLDELYTSAYGHLQRGDLDAAEADTTEGMRRAASAPWDRRFKALRAEVLGVRGRNADVLALVGDPPPPGDPPDAADVRARVAAGRARCVAPDSAESFRRAERDLAEAQALAERVATPGVRFEVDLCRGTCAAMAGDLAAAESRYREVLDGARREKNALFEAKAASALGWIRVRAGRHDDAVDWLGRALELSAAAGAELDTVKILHNLAWCSYKLGEWQQALSFLARGEALAAARGFADELHRIYTTMGNTHLRLGDLDSAAADYRRALALARELGHRGQTATLLGNLARVGAERRAWAEAERDAAEALRIQQEIGDIANAQYSLAIGAAIRQGRGDLGGAEATFRAVIASPHTDAPLLWGTHAALAKLLVQAGRPAEADAEFREAFELMESSRAQLAASEPRIAFFASLRDFHDGYVGFLVDQKREAEALVVADRGRARLLRERGSEAAAPESFQPLAAALDAVLLFYWMGDERSFLWVVDGGGQELFTLPGEADIAAHVAAHQARILRSRDPLAEGADDAAWLYDRLVRPAAARIPPGSRVIIAPDGPLHQLNFETLVVAQHYWIEDVTVATAPSLGLLSAGDTAKVAQRLLIIGDPAPADAEFPRLPATADEVRRVAAQFEPTERTVHTGAEAEPSVYLRSRPAEYSFIHFAAHAQANAEAPLDSAVILSTRDEGHKLYARDIAAVAVRAELVTLSACRSAGSRAYAGEGLVGLAWAFLGAGARNVVAGLWDVADTSTPELMDELYRGLRRGLPPAEALRAAKLGFLRSEGAYRKPFYWAPFVIYTRG